MSGFQSVPRFVRMGVVLAGGLLLSAGLTRSTFAQQQCNRGSTTPPTTGGGLPRTGGGGFPNLRTSGAGSFNPLQLIQQARQVMQLRTAMQRQRLAYRQRGLRNQPVATGGRTASQNRNPNRRVENGTRTRRRSYPGMTRQEALREYIRQRNTVRKRRTAERRNRGKKQVPAKK